MTGLIDPDKLSTTVLIALHHAIDEAAIATVKDTRYSAWTAHDLDTADAITAELNRRDAWRYCTAHFAPLISPDTCEFCEVSA